MPDTGDNKKDLVTALMSKRKDICPRYPIFLQNVCFGKTDF